jgi:sterol desaturase/sphingolipid hydroxylase (fatty acid hydroxylase superfamily)
VTILAVTFGSLLGVALWELARPRRTREFPAVLRRSSNLGIWLGNILLAAAIFRHPETWRAPIGDALPTWSLRGPISFASAFLLLDLMRYAVHRCKHAVPLFWRFHALHHSDPDPDFSTAVRQHPLDFLVGSAGFWLVVIALDIPSAEWSAYGLAVFTIEAIQHGNISLPRWMERWLRPVFVTTGLHRIHHSVVFAESNANFGAVFSVWDRVFGTLAQPLSAEPVFGVAELSRADACQPLPMLLTPWRLPR